MFAVVVCERVEGGEGSIAVRPSREGAAGEPICNMESFTCTCRLLTTLLKLPSLTLHHNSLPLVRQSLEATSTLVLPQKDCHPSRQGPRACTVYVHALLTI